MGCQCRGMRCQYRGMGCQYRGMRCRDWGMGEVPDSAAQSYIFRINVIVILGWVLRSLQCYVIDYS